jgi:hypothetical protein
MADLGLQPASNAFLESHAAIHQEKRYPLRAKVCETCKLVQLDYDVAPQELFDNYVYFSSYSDQWLAHAKAYCEMARERFALGQQRRILVEELFEDGHSGAGHRPVRYGSRGCGEDRRTHIGAVLR